jgi:hypothetical protein
MRCRVVSPATRRGLGVWVEIIVTMYIHISLFAVLFCRPGIFVLNHLPWEVTPHGAVLEFDKLHSLMKLLLQVPVCLPFLVVPRHDADDDRYNCPRFWQQYLSINNLLMTTIQRDPHNRRKTIVNRQVFSADLPYYTCFFAFCSSPRQVLVAVGRLPSLTCGVLVDQTWRRQRVMSPSGHPAPSASVNSSTSSSLAFINTLCVEKKEKSSHSKGPFSCCYETPHFEVCYRNSCKSSTLSPAAHRRMSQGGFMCYGAGIAPSV